MKTINVNEASGAALDWLVAKCEGYVLLELADGAAWHFPSGEYFHRQELYSPSTDWAQGGPIIEREKISTRFEVNAAPHQAWDADSDQDSCDAVFGPTPLIAAMRYYVASKLGDTVEVPEELVP